MDIAASIVLPQSYKMRLFLLHSIGDSVIPLKGRHEAGYESRRARCTCIILSSCLVRLRMVMVERDIFLSASKCGQNALWWKISRSPAMGRNDIGLEYRTSIECRCEVFHLAIYPKLAVWHVTRIRKSVRREKLISSSMIMFLRGPVSTSLNICTKLVACGPSIDPPIHI